MRMSVSVIFCVAGILGISTLAPRISESEPVEPPMIRAYETLKQLQPYLVSMARFDNAADHESILKMISALNENFHSLEQFERRFKEDPGFQAAITQSEDLLDDAERQFKDGRKGYALSRMRALSSTCASCHTTYNVKTAFQDKDPDLAGFTPLERGEFYLATRQFSKASEALLTAIESDTSPFVAMQALRRWLVIQVRVIGSAGETRQKLEELQKKLSLPRDDDEVLRRWSAELRQWEREGPASLKTIADIERIVKQSLSVESAFGAPTDTIALLRATQALHTLLGSSGLSRPERGKALLLLGMSYLHLRLFFIEEIPESYLRRCILENPGSEDAKRAYTLHKESVLSEFSGRGAEGIPGDVAADLKDLYAKAYAIPAFEGKI